MIDFAEFAGESTVYIQKSLNSNGYSFFVFRLSNTWISHYSTAVGSFIAQFILLLRLFQLLSNSERAVD